MNKTNGRGVDGLLGSSSDTAATGRRRTAPSNFMLQWGNRKRLRCMKFQVKEDSGSPVEKTGRRMTRTEPTGSTSNGYLNQRHRASPSPLLPAHRILRNSESRSAQDKRGEMMNNNDNNNKSSPETAQDSKKGGSSSDTAVVWPPKFVIGLTNKEKEEDFMAIKGSKLPHRPKKRAKFIQRTVNLVCPGGWLCDLTLERYEVREKKMTKKRPRGLKAMGNNMDSDSE